MGENKEFGGLPGPEANADAACVPSGTALVSTKPSEILSAAADLIEPEGRWMQGDYAPSASPSGSWVIMYARDLSGASCFCMAGAVAAAWPEKSAHIADIEQDDVWSFVEPIIGVGRRDVPDWNDDPARTQAEVVAALRLGAEKAREAGQ